MNLDRLPVIVGVGEVIDRPADAADGLEPLALMAEALRRAEGDAGAALLRRVDWLDVICMVSWRYRDAPRQLCERLGIAPSRAHYGVVGGETPIACLYAAARRIARGECRVAAVCGAESQHTASKAAQAGRVLPWTPFAVDAPAPKRGQDFVHPLAAALGVSRPITIYPFYEVAASAAWGQTPREGRAETGALYAAMSRVASANPNAWSWRPFTCEEVTTPSADNRLIAWPYGKRMVANPLVNMGAAVLVTSLAEARSAGVPADRIVHVQGGAFANEPRDYLARDGYAVSHAQDAVLQAVAAPTDAAFDAVELYSCFPCVPKMARRTLGLPPECPVTVTGGLSFFGAPLNNYMAHATCAMVGRLRVAPGRGLLYGQGEFVTKHHALVLGSEPPCRSILSVDADVQSVSDARRGSVPDLAPGATGAATVETATAIYDRDGSITHGVVLTRTADGRRTPARVPGADDRTLALLTSLDRSPVGATGRLTVAPDGISEWRGEDV